MCPISLDQLDYALCCAPSAVFLTMPQTSEPASHSRFEFKFHIYRPARLQSAVTQLSAPLPSSTTNFSQRFLTTSQSLFGRKTGGTFGIPPPSASFGNPTPIEVFGFINIPTTPSHLFSPSTPPPSPSAHRNFPRVCSRGSGSSQATAQC